MIFGSAFVIYTDTQLHSFQNKYAAAVFRFQQRSSGKAQARRFASFIDYSIKLRSGLRKLPETGRYYRDCLTEGQSWNSLVRKEQG
jgi:hypothetical protein